MRLDVAGTRVPRQSPEMVEAGLRSRSAGQSETLLPKTTTEDRVLSSSSIRAECDLERDVGV
jgi:hypothetical protein